MWMVFIRFSAASIFKREREDMGRVSLEYKGALMYTLGVCMIG